MTPLKGQNFNLGRARQPQEAIVLLSPIQAQARLRTFAQLFPLQEGEVGVIRHFCSLKHSNLCGSFVLTLEQGIRQLKISLLYNTKIRRSRQWQLGENRSDSWGRWSAIRHMGDETSLFP